MRTSDLKLKTPEKKLVVFQNSLGSYSYDFLFQMSDFYPNEKDKNVTFRNDDVGNMVPPLRKEKREKISFGCESGQNSIGRKHQ